MVIELITQIEEAEKKADEQRALAQAEVREMVKATQEACLEQERIAQQEIRQLYQNNLLEKQQMVEKEITSQEGARETMLQALADEASKNIQKATQFVFEKVVKDGNR